VQADLKENVLRTHVWLGPVHELERVGVAEATEDDRFHPSGISDRESIEFA
jgi:hypothetical protein